MYQKPSPQQMPQIEAGSSKSKNRALVIIQEDEGFNWNNMFLKMMIEQCLLKLLKNLSRRLKKMKKSIVLMEFLKNLMFLIL
ncbi:hypothetical protein Hanom_Chr06g00535791 [Helianthus anomalus]